MELCTEMQVITGRRLSGGSQKFNKNSCKKTAKVVKMFTAGEIEKERQNKGLCPL